MSQRNRKNTSGRIWLALCLLVLCLAGIFGWREWSLNGAQREFQNLLEQQAGNYNENRVVLSSTNRAEAQAMADEFGGTLRITKNGRFAVINLPNGMTLSDIAGNSDYRKYHDRILLDYNNFSTADEDVADDTQIRSGYVVEDPMYAQQTYIDYLNIGSAWDLTRGADSEGGKVTVAVIDTGIDTDHPEFYDADGNSIISSQSYDATNDKVVDQYDISVIEDTNGHGTAVAGIIAAQMNKIGTVGIVPDVELLVIKCENDEAGAFKSSADIVFAIYYAIEMDVDVINMSLGGTGGEDMAKALQLAVDSDIICVASAGNDSTDLPHYPSAFDTVIGVGALAEGSWEIADYSNFGINSDIMAPGAALTAAVGGGYTYRNGTSISAPMVTAAVALYKAQNRYVTYNELKAELLAAGKDLGDLGEDNLYGFGALDIHAFVCEEKGTITYDYCTEEIKPTTQVFVRRHTIQTVPEPERENIVFDDWYYDKAYTRVFDYDAWYSTEFVEDVTLYAKWVNEDDEGASVYNYRTLADGTIEIVSYKGKRRYLTIPNEIDGKTVSSIGIGAFADNTRLREVTCPEGLVYIKESAFSGVSKMREITFTGARLREIQDSAFSGCSALRKLNLPDSVNAIGQYAFNRCSAMNSVVISENSSLNSMGDFAFSGTAVSSFYIPQNVTADGFNGSVLSGCSGMRAISVHSGNAAFTVSGSTLYNVEKNVIVYYPAALTGSYTVADGVDTIGKYAFYGSSIPNLELNAVQTIGDHAFTSTKKLSSAVLPDTVTTLGEVALASSSITQVTLSGKLITISKAAFSGSKLAGVHIPAAVKTIEASAFASCSYLQTLTFADDSMLDSIGDAAFSNCEILKTFDLPDSLTSIGKEALASCRSITSLAIPANVSFIGERAFRYCSLLQQVDFADGCVLKEIPNSCFENCTMLLTVNFSDGIVKLGRAAFSNNHLLRKLNFGENSGLTTVGDSCFYSCSALQTMQLPESVTTIGQFAYAFSGLNRADITANISSIGNGAFGACYQLTEINVDEANAVYASADNVLFSKDISIVYCVPASRAGSYTLPETVKITAPYSFYYDKFLTAVVLPQGLEDIQMNSFYSCSSLAGIEIPAKVMNIGRQAFENCYSLAGVTFGKGSCLERLGMYTFVNCGLTDITIPASVKEIAQYVFYNCDSLRKITFEENSALSYVAAYLFKGTRVDTVVFEEGSGLTSLQAHAFDGAAYLKTVDFGNAKITNVDNYAFYNCAKLEGISLPDTVTNVGRYAFYGCAKLDQIDLPATVDYIGESAFSGTNNIRVFFAADNLPANVQTGWDKGISGYFLGAVDYVVTDEWEYSVRRDGTVALSAYKGIASELTIDTVDGYRVSRIGTRCFYNQDTLASLTLSENITEIGNYAFYDCDGLTTITLPNSVERIGKYAFADSTVSVILADGSSLEVIDDYAFSGNITASLVLPDSVVEIGDGAFQNSSLTDLDISQASALETIGQQAFTGSGITEIYLPASLKTVGAEAFKDVVNLSNVEIAAGDTALKLSNGAFEGCGINEITIPARVWYIGEYTLGSCRNLKNIYVDAANTSYTSLDGVLCDIGGTTLIQYPCGRSGAYEVPAQIHALTYSSFRNAKHLTEVTFAAGSTVRTIGWQTFSGCESLKKITVPDTVVSFDFYAFENCTALTDVILGEGTQLSGVYEGAFYNCTALVNITLPDTVVEISDYAFYHCAALTELPLSENSQVKGIYDYAFYGCCGITELPTLPQLVEIGEYAFAYTNITEYTVGAALKDIASNAFTGSESFTTIYCDEANEDYVAIDGALYEKGATSAADYEALVVWPYANILFVGKGKTEITAEDTEFLKLNPEIRWEIADTVVKIGAYAFRDHISMKRLTIPEQITDIGAYAFSNCWSLEEIYFNAVDVTDFAPVTAYDIYSGVFANVGICTDGVTLTVGKQVTKIPAYMFSGCLELTQVEFEKDSRCESVRKYAFANCRKLASVTIPESITAIADYAFSGDSCILIFEADTMPGTLGTNWAGMSSAVTGAEAYGITDTGFFYCITADKTALVGRYCGSSTSVRIPAEIDGVPVKRMVGTFCEYSALQYVTIPEGITSIGAYSFYNCAGLKSVTIPESVASIDSYAFYRCSGVEEFAFNAVSLEDFKEGNNVFFGFGAKTSGVEMTVGCKVTKIPAHMFRPTNTVGWTYDPNITSVKFEENSQCEVIGTHAFEFCTNLGKISIPTSVQRIDWYAFEYCNSIFTVGPVGCGYDYEFAWTDAIPDYAFYGIDNLKTAVLPEGLSVIGDGAFSFCNNLEYISIPESVTACRYIFSNCNNLKTAGPIGGGYNVEFGWTEEIPEAVFSGCYYMEEVVLPEGISAIGASAFSSNSAMKSIILPDGLEIIGNHSFSSCTSLENIEFPESVSSIGDYAFNRCTALSTVEIPASIVHIGENAFSEGVQNIIVWSDTLPENCGLNWSGTANVILNPKDYGITENGFQYYVGQDNKATVFGYIGTAADIAVPNEINGYPVVDLVGGFRGNTAITSITIPESVAVIEDYAFYGCSSLVSVVLPKQLEYLGEYAFYGCSQLSEITISEELEKIESYTFYGCTSLAEIQIPDTVTVIGESAFQDCRGLQKIIIPESVFKLEEYAFYGCTGLSKVTVLGSNTVLERDVFRDCSNLTTAGPLGGEYDYEFAWENTIPDYAFCQCRGLTNVTIPEGCLSIGQYAFAYCQGLTNIPIPYSVLEIGGGAFDTCQQLTSIVIPEGVAEINNNVFASCINLKEVIIPEGVYRIGASAFYSCYIPNIHLPSTLRTIESSAFYRCGFQTIELPSGLTTIADDAFGNCYNLCSIVIPERVTTIGNNAFSDCRKLDVVYILSDTIAQIVTSSSACGSLTNYATAVVIPSNVKTVGSYITTNFSYTEEISQNNCDYTMYSEFSIGWELAETVSEYVACQQDGVHVYQCTTCDIQKDVVESAHVYTEMIEESVTCMEAGAGHKTCDRCGSTISYEIPPVGYHMMGQWYLVEAATELTAGLSQRDCTACDYSETGEFTVTDSGTCNTNFVWSLTSDGTLWLSGTGTLEPGSYYSAPWYTHRAKITSVQLEGFVTGIGNYAFYNLSKLDSITIPVSVEIIGRYAFSGCKKLESIEIPQKVVDIGVLAFEKCDNLDRIEVHSENIRFCSVNGILYNKSCSTLIACPPNYTGGVTLHANTNQIGQYAFAGCTKVTGITLPDKLLTIGDGAFSTCQSLSSITIPALVTRIPYGAFASCTALTEVTISEGVEYIFDRAFADCIRLNKINFLGDPPRFYSSSFLNNVANAYYPADNDAWTDSVKQNYGGTITWLPVCSEHEWGEWTIALESTCEEAGQERRDCRNCDFFETREIPATGHDYGTMVTDPTCTEQGYTTHTCTACGDCYVDTYVEALGHKPGEIVVEDKQEAACEYDGSYDNVVYCSVCNEELSRETVTVPATGHRFCEWATTKKPTCTESGEKQRTCSDCGKVETEVIPAMGHSYEAVVTDPTCTEEGYTTHTCSACGDNYVSDYVTSKGHNYESVVTDSTCTEQGYTTHICSACGDSYADAYVDALGHALGEWYTVTTAACEEEGEERRDCERCAHFESRTVPALGHTWDEGTVTVEATEESEGEMLYTCTVCKKTRTEVIPTLEHVHKYESAVTDPTCTEEGYTTFTCVCGDIYTDDIVAALGHDMCAWSVIKDATCTENGEEHRSCSRCDHEETQVIPATGHIYESVVTEPTCSAQGYTSHTCSACGDSYADSYTNALGHSFTHYVSDGNATCTEDGTMTAKCDRCDAENTVSEAGSATGHSYEHGICTRCGKADSDFIVTEIASGWSGDTTWVLTSDGVLTFSGTGAMKNYTYKSQMPWYSLMDQITDVVIEEGITRIGSYAFYGMAIETIEIPDTVTVIGEYAFKGAEKLETVELPGELTKIGEAAFYGCTSLKEIYIPDTVYTVFDYTFKNCTALETVRFSKVLIKIGQGAFENCTSLDYVFIPTKVEIIGSWSFKGCTGLKEADMQWADATKIREGAFKNCSALTKIILPADIEILGDSCFYGIGAKTFTVPETVTSIEAWCFARAKLTEIIFEGDAPTIGEGAFNKIALTAYYPADNATWTADIMQNYGGKITWKNP